METYSRTDQTTLLGSCFGKLKERREVQYYTESELYFIFINALKENTLCSVIYETSLSFLLQLLSVLMRHQSACLFLHFEFTVRNLFYRT